MPDCPMCGDTLAICERGFICFRTLNIYSFEEAHEFKGYDPATVSNALRLFYTLTSAGLLGLGANRVEFLDDGLLIERLDNL